MTQISDNLHLGNAPTLVVGSPQQSGGRGFGPVGRCYIYDIVPLALNAANIAASQSPVSAAIALAAGTGVTAIVDASGVTRYTFDVPRAVRIVSGGNDSGITFLIKGYDFYGAAMSQSVTGANIGTATSTKAFMSVISIAQSGAVAGTITAGTTDVFGLPISVVDAAYIAKSAWNNTLAQNAGTFVAADTTTPATTITGDVRGTYTPAGAASNGVIRIVLTLALSNLNVGGGQTVVGVLGQPQV